MLGSVAALLAGCASQVPPPPPAPPAERVTPAPDPRARSLAELESRQRDAADAAARQGRWADALWALDVLRALRPDDGDLSARRAQALTNAQAGSADRVQRARQALQRSDTDGATRLFLEALTLAPGQPDAAEGLRAIERDRVRRQHLGQLSRNVLNRRGSIEPMPINARSSAAGGPSGGERNEIEHASLLAAQGEFDGAIALLKPLVDDRRGAAAARSLLADMYCRQAETLAPSDRVAALAAAQRCQQTNPAHPQVGVLLVRLQDAAAAGAGKARR